MWVFFKSHDEFLFLIIRFLPFLVSTMGEKKCRGGNSIKGLLIGIAIALSVLGILYLSHKQPDLSESLNQITNWFPKSNSTMAPEIIPEHPKDTRLKIPQAEIDELLQSVETYKSMLPSSIVNTIINLAGQQETSLSTTEAALGN